MRPIRRSAWPLLVLLHARFGPTCEPGPFGQRDGNFTSDNLASPDDSELECEWTWSIEMGNWLIQVGVAKWYRGVWTGGLSIRTRGLGCFPSRADGTWSDCYSATLPRSTSSYSFFRICYLLSEKPPEKLAKPEKQEKKSSIRVAKPSYDWHRHVDRLAAIIECIDSWIDCWARTTGHELELLPALTRVIAALSRACITDKSF